MNSGERDALPNKLLAAVRDRVAAATRVESIIESDPARAAKYREDANQAQKGIEDLISRLAALSQAEPPPDHEDFEALQRRHKNRRRKVEPAPAGCWVKDCTELDGHDGDHLTPAGPVSRLQAAISGDVKKGWRQKAEPAPTGEPVASVAHFVEWLNDAPMADDSDAKYAWDNGFPYSWVCIQYHCYKLLYTEQPVGDAALRVTDEMVEAAVSEWLMGKAHDYWKDYTAVQRRILCREFRPAIEAALSARPKQVAEQGDEDAEVAFGQVEPDDCDVQYPDGGTDGR